MKRFSFEDFDHELEAELTIQDELNAAQKKWREKDGALPIGDVAIGEVDVQPNPYL